MLVDAEKAKEKLAKVCERTIPVIAENGNVHGVVPMNAKQCAAAIRAADLSDCSVEPTNGLLMSMAMRYDHGLGVRGYYGSSRSYRLTAAVSLMRQVYEEVSGKGFYSPDKEEWYKSILDAAKEGK